MIFKILAIWNTFSFFLWKVSVFNEWGVHSTPFVENSAQFFFVSSVFLSRHYVSVFGGMKQ